MVYMNNGRLPTLSIFLASTIRLPHVGHFGLRLGSSSDSAAVHP